MKRFLRRFFGAVLLIVGITPVLANEDLARRIGCVECHRADKKVVGPNFQDVAAKYRNAAGAREALIEIVKKGGKGHWTEISGGSPMPPYSARLSEAEIAQLIDWILSQ